MLHCRTMLKVHPVQVDTLGMQFTDLEFDTLDQQNLHVMQAYAVRDATAKASREDHDGWLDRFDAVDGVDPQRLTQVHGQLIAMGMLRFELASRSVGLRYQISPRGRQALEAAKKAATDESDEELPHDQPAAEAQVQQELLASA